MKARNTVLVALVLAAIGLAVLISNRQGGAFLPLVSDTARRDGSHESQGLADAMGLQERGGRVAVEPQRKSPGRSFLEQYWGEQWDQVYAQFLASGGDDGFLDTVDPDNLENWESIKDDVVQLALEPIASEEAPLRTRTLSWSFQSGVSDPYGPEFSVNGRAVPQDAIPQIREALFRYDESLRDLAVELSTALHEAVRHAIYSGAGVKRGPFFGSFPAPAEKAILSSTVSHGGWSVNIHLLASQYPGVVGIYASISDVKAQRLSALMSTLKELGWE